MSDTANDFSKGSIVANIMKLAVPMTLAQLINVLYNIIDRIYIGRIPENATLALTGLGLCLPIISMVIAFANLFGMGGAPLCSIERGRGNKKEAELIMGNSFVLMVLFGIGLTVVGLALKKPMLYLFGASDNTYPYADQYISIYLLDDRSGDEQLHQFAGLRYDRYDDRAARRDCQYYSGSHLYLHLTHGSAGSGACHDSFPAAFGRLDRKVFNGQQGDLKTENLGVPAEEAACKRYRGPWHVGVYHGDYQQLGADYVQCVAAALRR